MKLYTTEEIVEDIKKFEGVDVKLHEVFNNARYLKLYSDVFSTSISENSTVSRLQSRIMEFVQGCNILIPPCDIYPTQEYKHWVYKAAIAENKIVSLDKNSTLLFTSNDEYVEIVRKLESGEYGSGKAFVISSESDEIAYYEGTLH